MINLLILITLTELYVCFGCKNNVQISYNMQKQIIELNSALANSCLSKEKYKN